MTKSLLAMATRHVAEGEARIARLEEIIAELERGNHSKAAALGREVLATSRESLALAVAHLAEIKEKG